MKVGLVSSTFFLLGLQLLDIFG